MYCRCLEVCKMMEEDEQLTEQQKLMISLMVRQLCIYTVRLCNWDIIIFIIKKNPVYFI